MPALCLLNTLTPISVCSSWKSSDWLWGGGFQTTCPLPRQHSYLRRLDIRQIPLFSFSWPKHPHQPMQYPPLACFPSYFLLAGHKQDERFQNYRAMPSSSPAAAETLREHPCTDLARCPWCLRGLSSSTSYISFPPKLHSCKSCSMATVLQGLMQCKELQMCLAAHPCTHTWHHS